MRPNTPAPGSGQARSGSAAALPELIQGRIGDRLFVSVSNREPFVHTWGTDGKPRVRAAVGGLTTALNAAMRATGGVWVAHGSGDADRAASDRNGSLAVPPDDPAYTLQRVWLTDDEHNGYYNGFANQALWPLCHAAYQRPVFRDAHWRAYRRVNAKFADAVARTVGGREAIVFVQDYHFALLPALLRERCPSVTSVHFWHIPWPSPDVLAVCPWASEIVEGILGNDVFGLHIPRFADRFVRCTSALTGWKAIDRNTLTRGGRAVRVEPFPISIDFAEVSARAASRACDRAVERLRQRYGLTGKFVILGLDRIDYTKGVLERLEAVNCLLQSHPELIGNVVYLHAGAPSRTDIAAYRQLHTEMDSKLANLNEVYGTDGWQPAVALTEHLHLSEVLALYRLADVCVVSSLDDGMNLVAKEFIAARNDESGHLLLSEFTGAAWELPGAETFNPLATDDFAGRLFAASQARPKASRPSMRRLRAHVQAHDIFGWLASILESVPPAGCSG